MDHLALASGPAVTRVPAADERPTRIVVSNHAVDRLMERFPGNPNVRSGREAVYRLIHREVAEAMRDWRFSSRAPKGFGEDRLTPRARKAAWARQHGHSRYAWTEDVSRVYKIKKEQAPGRGMTRWIVITVMAGGVSSTR